MPTDGRPLLEAQGSQTRYDMSQKMEGQRRKKYPNYTCNQGVMLKLVALVLLAPALHAVACMTSVKQS